MVRASKRAKRSGDSPTTSTKAVASPRADSDSNCPHLHVQNTSSHLVQPCRQLGKDKSSYHQQTRDDSLEYTRSVLAGAESLGIELTPSLQKDLGNRRGRLYSLGSFSDRSFELVNGFNEGAAACDMEVFLVSQGYHEAAYDFEFKKDDWESDYAGIGHQFANLLVGEDRSQLRH